MTANIRQEWFFVGINTKLRSLHRPRLDALEVHNLVEPWELQSKWNLEPNSCPLLALPMVAWVGLGQSLHVCCCWFLVRGISFAHVIQAPRMLVRCVQRQSPQRNWLQRCWLLPNANHPDVSEMLGSRFSAFFR